MNNIRKNIFNCVVDQDLCVGCGACAYKNHKSGLKMDWNKEGFLVPTIESDKKNNPEFEDALKVCPFNPFPEDKVRTENELAEIFLKEAPNYHPKAGKYFNTYAGYSEQFRLSSSSGGLATYVLNELFEQKIIDAAITVGEGSNEYYEYKFIKKKEDLLSTSKTRYYPVTMDKVLKELESFDGKVAVVGVGSTIKAIRLLQYYYPELREKIVFTIGIICGGLKSRFFAEYLAGKAGAESNDFTKPQFRIKDYKSTAGDYSFGCKDNKGDEKQVKMRTVGDMWGSGMFKCNACDFCDDVTSELADISLGDAWISPYSSDGKGTNIIVTRSTIAERLIVEGVEKKTIQIEQLSFERFLISQQGSFNHRHKGLKYRVQKARKQDLLVPPKRHDNENITPDFMWVQNKRMKIRKDSLINWASTYKADSFDLKMSKELNKLKRVTRIYHYIRAIKRRLGL